MGSDRNASTAWDLTEKLERKSWWAPTAWDSDEKSLVVFNRITPSEGASGSSQFNSPISPFPSFASIDIYVSCNILQLVLLRCSFKQIIWVLSFKIASSTLFSSCIVAKIWAWLCCGGGFGLVLWISALSHEPKEWFLERCKNFVSDLASQMHSRSLTTSHNWKKPMYRCYSL